MQVPECEAGTVILQTANGERWRHYRKPVRIIQTSSVEQVLPTLHEIELYVQQGKYAVGFVSYEAAPAFDSALKVVSPTNPLPLVWFGIFDAYETIDSLDDFPGQNETKLDAWTPNLSEDKYHSAIQAIHEYIANGDTYQVNFTIRLRSCFHGSEFAFFKRLVSAQEPRYAAYLETGSDVICSASPELFFTLDGENIVTHPMKGTRPRGLWYQHDLSLRNELHDSEKDRAENVMIVDMVRNDLGRIAKVGTVKVPSLFDIERLYTVWQLTSTVTAETSASFTEIFRALFPCASITGAPKIRTTEIIRDLEREPRGIYTGVIGYLDPHRIAQFNVAIRTVHIHRATQSAVYGTGGGIVWDSTPDGEYHEALDKAAILTTQHPTFSLLETIRWTTTDGYFLLDRHLQRMENSASYFGFLWNRTRIVQALEHAKADFGSSQVIVRILVDKTGVFAITHNYHQPTNNPIWRVELATAPISSQNRFLYHKTTYREIYDAAIRSNPELDDVILYNERGEITESTRANVVVKVNGRWHTPPVACGLLPGTYRAELLETGQIVERIISLDDWNHAERTALINSVRGWIKLEKN